MWSLHKNKNLTEEHELVVRFPRAACHDGEHVLFVHCLEEECDLLAFNEDGLVSVSSLGEWLVSDSVKPLHLTKNDMGYLFKTPEFRLWCASYSDDKLEVFAQDKNDVGVDVNLTQEQAKEAIKAIWSN